jgi:CheY-like chemotaxis protein
MGQARILYVEDEETDVVLLRLGFERAGMTEEINSVADGEDAINYLAGNGCFADRARYPLPMLVLLDINLPRKSGFEVLAWIRQQPQLGALPVVVYTSSARQSDRARACSLGASDYLVKPANLESIADIASKLKERWLARSAS